MEHIVEMLKMVREFYERFDQVEFIGTNKRPEDREKWFEEEKTEYEKALAENDKVEMLDAIVDMEYIYLGTLLEENGSVEEVASKIWFEGNSQIDEIKMLIEKHNFKKIYMEAFKEVHRSNLTKLDADGNVVYKEDGKIGKSELFEEPKLRQFIEKIKGTK